MQKILFYFRIIMAQKHKCRFLLSRLFMRAGLSRFIVFRRNGYRLRFYPSALTAALWINPSERLEEETFLMNLVGKGDVVIDVGANIGSISLALAQRVEVRGKIFAFEPHPRIYQYLEGNILLNGMEGIVQTHRMALGEHSGEIQFSDKSDDSNNAVVKSGGVSVQVVRLDDAVPVEPIKLLKIDVEGYEFEVLKGAAEVCGRAEMIYLECIADMLERNGASEDMICSFLTDLGFKLFCVQGERLTDNVIGSHRKKMILARK